MKVDDILLTEEQLHELKLRHAIAAGALGLGLLHNPTNIESSTPQKPTPQEIQQRDQHVAQRKTEQEARQKELQRQQDLANKIAERYHVDQDFALQVVQLAHKYEKPTFPKAKDILAIIGVESSFDPDAVSGLRHDPAVGLMQVRPSMWNLDREDLSGDVEKQIQMGSDILHQYYTHFKNPRAALAAYNVGPTNYRQGNKAPGYVAKYANELKHYLSGEKPEKG